MRSGVNRLVAAATACVVVVTLIIGSYHVVVVQSALGPPLPPLTSVAHDATLTGQGITASPLGISHGGVGTAQLANGAVTAGTIANGAVGTTQLANGAVTAGKLGGGAPTLGQFLGYDGTALAWQTPPSGGA